MVSVFGGAAHTEKLEGPDDGYTPPCFNNRASNVTETEAERLMGLPEGWTAYGAEGEAISAAQRQQALGNATQ